MIRLYDPNSAGKDAEECPGADVLERDADVTADRDIVAPVTRLDAIDMPYAAEMVLEGNSNPATEETEKTLYKRGVLAVPDFLANAGGVTCAAVAYSSGAENQPAALMTDKTGEHTRKTPKLAADKGIPLRAAARQLAETRLSDAMSFRRAF